MTRIGVLGAGAISQVAHLSVLPKFDRVEVVALCDIDLPKARSLAARLGIPDVYDDIEDLIALSKPDAVVVCTPNHLHEIHTITALASGVHVLCERPLALSIGGMEKIEAAREQSGAVVMVGMNHRFRSDVQTLRRYLEGGELGSLYSIRSGWYTFRPTRQALGWRFHREQSGGGAMLDLGLPLIDLGLWLAGYPRPESVSGQFNPADYGERVEDAGCALIRCKDGLSIIVDVSWRFVGDAEKFFVNLMLSHGSASIAPLKVFKEMQGMPINVASTGASGGENVVNASYRSEWAHFLAMVRGGIPAPTLEDQVLLHRTLEAVQQSARLGRDIEL
ncbi:MAG: Gfo/Idh/MocA family protein [Gemmatimonadales bacterium]